MKQLPLLGAALCLTLSSYAQERPKFSSSSSIWVKPTTEVKEPVKLKHFEDFDLGIEVGMCFAQFVEQETFNTKSGLISVRTTALENPVLGLTIRKRLKNRFYLSSGLQYNQIGLQKHYRKGSALEDRLEQEQFHKLSLPLIVGRTFPIGKYRPALFLGYRPNLLLKGNYTYQVFALENGPQADAESYAFDPLTNGNLNRFTHQVTLGCSLAFNRRLAVNVVLNMGETLDYIGKKSEIWGISPRSLSHTSFAATAYYFFQIGK